MYDKYYTPPVAYAVGDLIYAVCIALTNQSVPTALCAEKEDEITEL